MIYQSIIKHIKELCVRVFMKRVLVSLPAGTWKIIENELKGKIGEKDSEMIRNIVLAYLSDQGYMKKKG